MNAIQFNSLAIVFILGILPFSVAFITNAGSSSGEDFEESTRQAQTGASSWANYPDRSHWINNGGLNHTDTYWNQETNTGLQYLNNRTYIVDGLCPASAAPYPCDPWQPLRVGPSYAPKAALMITQTHFQSTVGYVGSSGDGPFTMKFNSHFFENLENSEAVDSFRFTMLDIYTTYNCASTTFVNLTFNGDLTFIKGNSSIDFNGFEFETDNKYTFSQYSAQHGYVDVCIVGFELEFDLTGFETITLDEFVYDDWFNTSIIINLDNFERADDAQPFSTEALPFAGDGFWTMGVEHRAVDPVQANFIIKSGTLFLSLATFAIAVASTPYWDPFRNFFRGMLE